MKNHFASLLSLVLTSLVLGASAARSQDATDHFTISVSGTVSASVGGGWLFAKNTHAKGDELSFSATFGADAGGEVPPTIEASEIRISNKSEGISVLNGGEVQIKVGTPAATGTRDVLRLRFEASANDDVGALPRSGGKTLKLLEVTLVYNEGHLRHFVDAGVGESLSLGEALLATGDFLAAESSFSLTYSAASEDPISAEGRTEHLFVRWAEEASDRGILVSEGKGWVDGLSPISRLSTLQQDLPWLKAPSRHIVGWKQMETSELRILIDELTDCSGIRGDGFKQFGFKGASLPEISNMPRIPSGKMGFPTYAAFRSVSDPDDIRLHWKNGVTSEFFCAKISIDRAL